MEQINIEQIMEEIRQEIRDKGYINDLFSFDDVIESAAENKTLEDYYDILNNIWNVQAYRVLPAGGGILGKFKVFVKKVLRKSIKFYIEPIVEDQDEFNANTVHILNLINSYMDINNKKMEMLKEEIENLKKQMSGK